MTTAIKYICTQPVLWDNKKYDTGDIVSAKPVGYWPREYFRCTHPKHSAHDIPTTLPKVKGGAVILLGTGPSLEEWIKNEAPTNTLPGACINKAGLIYTGPIQYWISLHSEFLAKWKKFRTELNIEDNDIKFIGSMPVYNPAMILSQDTSRLGGGSALYAAEVLGRIGYDSIITAGIDFSGPNYEIFRAGWKHLNMRTSVITYTGKVLHKGLDEIP